MGFSYELYTYKVVVVPNKGYFVNLMNNHRRQSNKVPYKICPNYNLSNGFRTGNDVRIILWH